MRPFTRKVRNTVILAVVGAVASGVAGMIVRRMGGGDGASLVSFPGLTIGCRGGDQHITQVIKGFGGWIFWWWPTSLTAPETPATPSSPPQGARVDAPSAEPRPASPTPSTSAPAGAQVVRRETKPLQPSLPPAKGDEVASPAPVAGPPPSASTAGSDGIRVIRLGPAPPSPRVFDERFTESVEAGDSMESKVEAGASASATLSLMTAEGVVTTLQAARPRHSPAAVVVEENCGTLQDGVYVPPSLPRQGLLTCTVRDEVGGNEELTTYQVAPEQ